MKKRISPAIKLLLAVMFCLAMLLQGCAAKGKLSSGPAAPVGSAPPGSAANSSTAPTQAKAVEDFAAAFKTVDKNPLNEDLQYALWLAASKPQDASATAANTSSSALKQFSDKYQALVADKGVHYTEVTDAYGMKITAEYWIKGGKFTKYEALSKQYTVYDGQTYVRYTAADKKGTRFTKADMQADIDIVLSGMLSKLAASPFKQQKDQRFEKFDCSVFTMDITAMGMSGDTLFVDKDTGMLVKNQYGDPKDKKNSMAIYISSFAVGGFGDDVFTVPAAITVVDN